MDPTTLSGVLGAGSMALPVVSSIGAALGASQQNAENTTAYNANTQTQEEMANTQYQRSVADMEAAGLNPGLMFGSGQPAPTPGMTQPSLTSPVSAGTSALTGVMSHGMDTAVALRGQNSTLALQGAQADLADSQSDNVDADTSNKAATKALIGLQSTQTAKQIEAQQYTNRMMAETLDSQIKKAKAEGDYAQINQLMGVIHAGSSSAGSLINPLSFLTGK